MNKTQKYKAVENFPVLSTYCLSCYNQALVCAFSDRWQYYVRMKGWIFRKQESPFRSKIRILIMIALGGFMCHSQVVANEIEGLSKSTSPSVALPDRPSIGDEDALITVLEIRSLTCSHCRMFTQREFPTLHQQFIDTGIVRWEILDTVVDRKKDNRRLLEIPYCLNQQNQYWQSEEYLFENEYRTPRYLIRGLGSVDSVKVEKLQSCYSRGLMKARVEADFKELSHLKIKQLPTFVLRRKRADGQWLEAKVDGYQTADYLARVIGSLLTAQ